MKRHIDFEEVKKLSKAAPERVIIFKQINKKWIAINHWSVENTKAPARRNSKKTKNHVIQWFCRYYKSDSHLLVHNGVIMIQSKFFKPSLDVKKLSLKEVRCATQKDFELVY